METAYVIGTILSGLAAVLAWLAKIYWSKEYREAKDETIRAKEAQIEQLKQQVQYYKDLTPMKIREYFDSVKEQLEEYNDALQKKLEHTRTQLKEKNVELKKFEQKEQTKSDSLEKIKTEKKNLELQISSLENKLSSSIKEEKEIKNFQFSSLNTIKNILISESVNIDDAFLLYKGMKDIVDWFKKRYHPATIPPHNEEQFNVQLEESYSPREIIERSFSEFKPIIIDQAVTYLEDISIYWYKKERIQ